MELISKIGILQYPAMENKASRADTIIRGVRDSSDVEYSAAFAVRQWFNIS